MTDFATVLKDLLAERATTWDRLVALDTAIGAVQPLVVVVDLVAEPKPPTALTARKASNGSASKLTSAQWERIHEQWIAGEKSVTAIAAAFGITDATVHMHAKAYRWPKRSMKSAAAAKPAAGTASELLGGWVACPSCHVKTERDPCQHCGAAVRKAVVRG